MLLGEVVEIIEMFLLIIAVVLYYVLGFAYRFFLFVPLIIALSIVIVEFPLRRLHPDWSFKIRSVFVAVFAVAGSTALYGPEWVGKAIFFYRCGNDQLYTSLDVPAPNGVVAIAEPPADTWMKDWAGCGSYCQELLLERRIGYVEVATYRVKRSSRTGLRERELVADARYTARRDSAACSHAVKKQATRIEPADALAAYASRGICIESEQITELTAPYVLETLSGFISTLPKTSSTAFSVRRREDGVIVGRTEIRRAKPGLIPPPKLTKDYRNVSCSDGSSSLHDGQRDVLNDVFDLGMDGRLQGPTSTKSE